MKVFGIERNYIIHDENNVKGFFAEYRWLSNYHVCDIYFEGILYPSTENAYQAAKSNDIFIRQQMVELTPNESKKFGQQITIRGDWHKIKYDVMCSVVFEKFYRHLDLRQALIDTGNKHLSEDNHWGDQYWGVCEGKGENSLGKILMAVRKFWQDKDRDKPKQLF
jgi:N-glycosidase YbiA